MRATKRAMVSSGSSHRTRKRGHDVVYVLLMQLLTPSNVAFIVSCQDRPSVVFKSTTPFHQQEPTPAATQKVQDIIRCSSRIRHSNDTNGTKDRAEDWDRPLCFYRAPSNNSWRPRFELGDLEVGQQLQATVVQDLFDDKNRPQSLLSSRRWSLLVA